MVALVGLLKLTAKLSFGSARRSPFTTAVTVLLVWPGAKVSVPLVAWKSLPDVALPSAVAQSTVTGASAADDRVTVKAIGDWLVLPSLPLAVGVIEIRGGSSSSIVPTPWASAMSALVGS